MRPSLFHWLATIASACASVGLVLSLACSSASGSGTPTPIAFVQQPADRSRAPTAETSAHVGSPSPSGLHIEDNCITGQADPPPSRGQISGNGVNIIIESNTPENFSRAVADTASVACRSTFQRGDLDQLVARLNGIPGVRVVDSSLTGR